MSNRQAGSARAPSERVRVKRLHERGHYDAATIHPILDAMPICSVGYVFKGSPYVTPTLQWREGGHIYWHGSSASRMLEAVEEAEEAGMALKNKYQMLQVQVYDAATKTRSMIEWPAPA